jgi:hypothetical protein
MGSFSSPPTAVAPELNPPRPMARSTSRSRWWTDTALAALIFCAGTWAGTRAVQSFRAAGGAQYFYQSDFGPAVMLACGRGFLDPDRRTAPALAAFLAQQADRFDCASLPPSVPALPLNAFQRSSQYLEAAVALTWKIAGVAWSRLAVLNGTLFGAVAAITYGLLRLAMSRVVALLMLAPAVTSTPNVMLVPQLRDYAKGPFLLAIMLLLGVLVSRPARRRGTIGLAGLAGAVAGTGIGFRTDVGIAMLPALIAIAALVPPSVPVRVRMVATAVFLASFLAVAFPVLRGLSGGGNNGHVALLGLTKDFDGPLRTEPSVYEFGGRYVDSLAFTIINSFAIRTQGRTHAVDAASADYERVATSYLRRIAAAFPADVVTRTAAAIRTIPKYFLDSSLYPPVQVGSPFLRETVYPFRARVLWRLGQTALFASAAATLVIAAVNPRAAWLVVLVMLGFAGASAIQFNERHFYYLQFLPWFAFGVLVQVAVHSRHPDAFVTRDQVQRAVIFAAIVAVSGGGIIWLSRAYQQHQAALLFARYEAAPRTPLPVTMVPAGAGRTLVAASEWLQPMPPGVRAIETRFIAVRFRDDRCGPAALPVTIRYDGRRHDADLSESITVRLRAGAPRPTTLFVAAYDWADEYIRFRGIEVADDRSACVGGLSRVDGLEPTPLLLTTTLGADWRAERLYQRLH